MATFDPLIGDPLIVDSGNGGDLLMDGGQPVMSSGIENAVYLSLFVEPNWWGNDIDPANPGAVGSYHFLPLVGRAKLTPSLVGDVTEAIKADLEWMQDDGVTVGDPGIVIELQGSSMMALELTFTEPDATETTVRHKINWAYMAEVSA